LATIALVRILCDSLPAAQLSLGTSTYKIDSRENVLEGRGRLSANDRRRIRSSPLPGEGTGARRFSEPRFLRWFIC